MGQQTKAWMGGINYQKNLLFALQSLKVKKIKPIVFLGKKTDPDIISMFVPYAEIVLDSMFDRMSLKWIISSVFSYYLRSPFLLNALMKKHSIDVISHSRLRCGGINCKIVSWIPDFQHLHLPDMFSSEEIYARNQKINTMIQNSDAVILSSHDAYNDCLQFDKTSEEKLHVLQFVSQPNPAVFTLAADFINNKHNVPEKYFYLPNQLWRHKNHLCVFKAIKNLKAKGVEINLLCSGSLSDYRNTEFINEIKSYVIDNKLEDNIKILGLIDYIDVLYFMRYSIAVINPSLFEGWSSTVEECKSIGKNMILSNLKVHKEQNPAGSSFFELDNIETLEALLESMWKEETIQPNTMLEQAAAEILPERTYQFAKKYEAIVVEVVKS